MPCRRQPNNFRRPSYKTPGTMRRSMNAPLIDNDEPMLFVDDGTGNWEGTARDPDFGSIGTGGATFSATTITGSVTAASYQIVFIDAANVMANLEITLPSGAAGGDFVTVRCVDSSAYTHLVKPPGSQTLIDISNTDKSATGIDVNTNGSAQFFFNGTATWYQVSP